MTYLAEMQEHYQDVRGRIYAAGYRFQWDKTQRQRTEAIRLRKAYAVHIEQLKKERVEKAKADAIRRRLKLIRKIDVLFGRAEPGQDESRSMTRILAEISMKHGVSPEDIISERRPVNVVIARHEFMYRCRMETRFSLPRIGRFICRDHSSVSHGINAHSKRFAVKIPVDGIDIPEIEESGGCKIQSSNVE